MRFHSRYPLLQLWSGVESIIRAGTLRMARLEPVIGDAVGGGGVLDLVFSDGAQLAVVPFIRVHPYTLIERERTPLIWPHAARDLGYDALGEIEREVLPWLQSLVLARQQNDEMIRTFGDTGVEALFGAARAAQLIGAAPYSVALPAIAPYVYAVRYAHQRSIAIEDPAGANGAAILALQAQSVCADLGGSERNGVAAQWFGMHIFGAVSGEYDVVIAPPESSVQARDVRITLDGVDNGSRRIDVAAAVPLDVLVSFDAEDAPVARTFSVRSNAAIPLRTPPSIPVPSATGGSAGNILLLVREDFERAPDTDTDEAYALAQRLRAEGFTVDLRGPSGCQAGYKPDLLHAFGIAHSGAADVLARMHASGVPIVANTNLGSAPQEAAWGPDILSAVFARSSDDGVLAEYLELITLRKLSTDDWTPASAPVPALTNVDVAIVASDAEAAVLRGPLQFGGDTVNYAPMLWESVTPSRDIAAVAGTRPYALVHAPVEWRTNLPLLARAAAQLGIPLVVAGPALSFACLRYALEVAPELIMHFPNLPHEDVEALYRGAHVYADVSWDTRGLGRHARAVANGCRLLVSRASHAVSVWRDAAEADPGSLESIRAALEQAWSAPEPATPQIGNDLFAASIYAYSQAVRRPQPA